MTARPPGLLTTSIAAQPIALYAFGYYAWRRVAHVKREDWVLMPTGKSPVSSDADRDIAVHGYCFFQVVDG
jgi:hypothetical protein